MGKLNVTIKLLALLAILTMANSSWDCLAGNMDVANKAKGSLVELTYRGKSFCSGFAVGRNVVATAKHCMADVAIEYNGVSCPTDRVVADDGHDHVFVYTCATYPEWVELGSTPKVGDKVFSWGRPLGLPWLYREGYVAGGFQDTLTGLVPFGTYTILLDMMGWKGDSGAPVFDEKGRVVGMVSIAYSSPDKAFHLAGIYPFLFTTEQLKEVGID